MDNPATGCLLAGGLRFRTASTIVNPSLGIPQPGQLIEAFLLSPHRQ